MHTIINDEHIKTLAQIRALLDGTQAVEFTVGSKQERYDFIRRSLTRFNYYRLSKPDKGLLLSFMVHVSGYSRIQVKRLAKTWLDQGQLKPRTSAGNGFTRKYTDADKHLLAGLDELHGTLSGTATKKLCERAWQLFGLSRYQQLAGISVAHLYNLRRSQIYHGARHKFQKTRSRASSLGERKKPQNAQPGYIRVDKVHQGDQDGAKGLYHINAIDEITQFDIVCAVEKISERYLIPVLEQLLDQFPFIILSFHADNGSEYINQHVAKLLKKLLIGELTKSPARHSNDNALVESKNPSIVRKYLGYSHIQQNWASLVNQFHQNYLNPYINYHRPCFFAVTKTNAKGKQVKTYAYEAMMTPYEKFRSLPKPSQYLKPGVTLKSLDAFANEMTDNEADEQLNSARDHLFKQLHDRLKIRA